MSSDLMEVFRNGLAEIIPAGSVGNIDWEQITQANQVELYAESAEALLGFDSAAGLFMRVGSASFKHLVRCHGKSIGIDSLEFRLQPQKQRLQDGVGKILALIQDWQAADFKSNNQNDSITVTAVPFQVNKFVAGQVVWLHFIAGLLQEMLYWAGGGKQYPFQVKVGEDDNSLVIYFQLQPVD